MESAVEFGFTAQKLIEEKLVTIDEIDDIRTWSIQEENLPDLTNEQIGLFLMCNRNKQEETKKTIKAFYTIRNQASELFDNRQLNSADLQKQMNTFEFCVFPERTDDGCAIVFCRLSDTTYYNAIMEPALKLCFMAMDSVVYDNPPKGLIVVIDFKGTGLMHLTRIRIGLLKTFCQYVQEAVPVKIKDIHVLNTVYFIDKMIMLVKPFIHSEVFKMIQFHQSDIDMEWFYQNCIPKRCLPEDYGGDLPSVKELYEKTIQKLTEMQSHFEAEQQQRYRIT